jgi:hypothetical protein
VTIQAYDPNIVTGKLTDFSVSLDASGKLSNSNFNTAIYTGGSPQTISGTQISYTGQNIASAEASTFAYANSQLAYLNSVGYSWGSSRPLTIVSNATIKGDANTAFYSPYDGQSGPYIVVGTGDSKILQNLSFDADVVSHELGHHIVFSSITNTDGESLLLHEGLADYFANARTGDACLGEGVCPTNGKLNSCVELLNKCLRSAENSLKYKDEKYMSYISDGHLTGQLISGLLWDLRKSNSVPADTLTKLVLQTISYLPKKATVKNFIAAFLYADSQNSSTYQTAITAAADKRGLAPSSLGITTTDLKSSAEADNSGDSTPHEETSESKKSFLGVGCTVQGRQNHSLTTGGIFLGILLVLPFWLSDLTRKPRGRWRSLS